MCLESESKNRIQLRDYACVGDWLIDYWTAENGTSGTQQKLNERDEDGGIEATVIENTLWPKDNPTNTLAMWVFWFMLDPRKLFVTRAPYCVV
jgi:hypothetical protein